MGLSMERSMERSMGLSMVFEVLRVSNLSSHALLLHWRIPFNHTFTRKNLMIRNCIRLEWELLIFNESSIELSLVTSYSAAEARRHCRLAY